MINISEFMRSVCASSLLALLVISHTAANESPVDATCHQQSGSKQQQPCAMELPETAIRKLKIDAGFGWGIFSGSIYNGNENYHVTQLTVSMIPIDDHHHGEMHTTVPNGPKIHQINLDLPPLSKGALSMPLAAEDIHIHDFEWKIMKVMGYQTR